MTAKQITKHLKKARKYVYKAMNELEIAGAMNTRQSLNYENERITVLIAGMEEK